MQLYNLSSDHSIIWFEASQVPSYGWSPCLFLPVSDLQKAFPRLHRTSPTTVTNIPCISIFVPHRHHRYLAACFTMTKTAPMLSPLGSLIFVIPRRYLTNNVTACDSSACVLIVPLHTVFIRSEWWISLPEWGDFCLRVGGLADGDLSGFLVDLVNFICFQAFLLYTHYMRENVSSFFFLLVLNFLSLVRDRCVFVDPGGFVGSDLLGRTKVVYAQRPTQDPVPRNAEGTGE